MDCCNAYQPDHIPAEDVTSHYGRWKAPDEDKAAIKHRAEHVHHDFFNVWASHVRDLKEFGVGHMMYFTFLWWMAALFCTLALLVGVPNLAINLAGKYYTSGHMELTTLGNFGRLSMAHNRDGMDSINTTSTGWELERDVAASFMGDAALPAVTTPFNKAAAIVAASVIDCIGAALYFVVTLGLILLARRRAEDADTHTVTIHDYSVYVRKLPPDATSSELADFFSQWGEVENVELIRAYGNMLKLVLMRGSLLQQLKSATAALQKAAEARALVPAALEKTCHSIKKKVAKVDKEIKAEQALGDTARVVGAFVTYRNESSRLNCLKATPQSWLKQWWHLKAQHKFRGKHPLAIGESPEPSDVEYENMEHGPWDRFGRNLLTLICSYTALGLGFLLISLATASQVQVSRTAGVNARDCNSCRLQDGGVFGVSDSDKELYKACDKTGKAQDGRDCSNVEKQCYRCYCYTSFTSGSLSDSDYCSSAMWLLVLQYGSQVGVVVAIVGINMLLTYTSGWLTAFEKHHTRSSQARTLAHRLFLAQFLNSAVSTIIANAHLPFLANLLDGTALAGIFFQGIYTDLTPMWYKVVGRSLLISQFVASALRMMYLAMRWGGSWWARRRRGACLTQEELDRSLRGTEFLLDHRYGEHLSVCFVAMLLSGAMPIVLFSAAFYFVTAYWCDKWELLKLSRRPVIYGPELSDHVMNMLPYAAVLHVAFAMWAFSLFGVYPSPLITGVFTRMVQYACNTTEAGWLAVSGISAEQLAQRLLSASAAHLLVLLIVMFGVLFLKLTLTRWVQAGRWLLNMAGLIADNEDTQHTGAPEFSVAVRTQLLVGEASYTIQDQPAYATAFTQMEHMEADVCVQVVLKGPSLRHRKVSQETHNTPQQQQPGPPQQQQQQLGQTSDSPRSTGTLGDRPAYSPPMTASTVAVGVNVAAGQRANTPGMQQPAAYAVPGAQQAAYAGASMPGQLMQQNTAYTSNAGEARDTIEESSEDDEGEESHKGESEENEEGAQQQQQQQRRNTGSGAGSSSGSRRGSRGGYPAIGGLDAGAVQQQQYQQEQQYQQQQCQQQQYQQQQYQQQQYQQQQQQPYQQQYQQQQQQYQQQYQQQFQQQYQQQQPGYDWPNMPRSAEGQSEGGQGYGSNAAVNSNSGAASGQAPSVQLSTAQRYRQARSNQVVPIPEEYLVARNMPVQD